MALDKFEASQKKISFSRILLGGSFDPPHLGHLQIVKYILTNACSPIVDIVPNNRTAFKKEKPVTGKHRLNMLKLLFAREITEKKVVLHTHELDSKRSFYTIESSYVFERKFPQLIKKKQIALLLGSDLLPHLHLWKDIKKLLERHSIITFLRKMNEGPSEGGNISMPKNPMQKLEEQIQNVRMFTNKSRILLLDKFKAPACSSTEIKTLLFSKKATSKNNKDLFSCLSKETINYIQENHLYFF